MTPDIEKLHRGLSFERTDDSKSNPRERIFAEAWNRINTQDPLGYSLLDKLCHEPRDSNAIGGPPAGTCTERDHQIAATVIQWLGSNIGQGFLDQTIPEANEAYTKWRIANDARMLSEHLASERQADARRNARTVKP